MLLSHEARWITNTSQMVLFRVKELTKARAAAPAAPAFTSAVQRSISMPHITSSARAQENITSGFHRLGNLSEMITSAAGRSSSYTSAPAAEPTRARPPSTEEIDAQARRDVEAEIHLYLSHPNVTGHISACNVLAFWQVNTTCILSMLCTHSH
jgi:hypothetical protein